MSRELLQQALEALESDHPDIQLRAAIALRKALETETEPVAWADMAVRGDDKGLSWTQGYFHQTPLWTQAHWTEYEKGIIAAEREACAELVMRGTNEPVQTRTLEILRKERARIAEAIRARGEK